KFREKGEPPHASIGVIFLIINFLKMSENYITGLDIGAGSIKAMVGQIAEDGKISILRVFKSPCSGMRKGAIDDFPEVSRSLNQIFGEIKNFSKKALKNIYVNVESSDVHTQFSRGIVAVSRADYEIHRDDIDRAVQASQAVKLSPNRIVLHAIIKEYIVDGIGDIRDPLGMTGNRLEVNSLIIDVFEPAIKNLTKCVESAGGIIGGLIFGPLASARSVLSKNQKDLGVVLVDIGFSTTGICVYEEGKLIHAAVLPVGASNVTNDLAIILKTSVVAAEAIKLSFGSALAREVSGKEIIDLRKIDPNAKNTTTPRSVAEIIETRLAEIFEFVNSELKFIGKDGQLPAGIVLVGGGSKIAGIVDLAKRELKLPAQIGIPETSSLEIANGELNLQIEDPEFACSEGLVLWGSEKFEDKGENVGSWFNKMMGYLKP
ncbi:MAG: cell division protein FtsA, partial [Patescibacteria group bacterium]|nr:cell division protein FtsA [Patescibacteria group bacterium]